MTTEEGFHTSQRQRGCQRGGCPTLRGDKFNGDITQELLEALWVEKRFSSLQAKFQFAGIIHWLKRTGKHLHYIIQIIKESSPGILPCPTFPDFRPLFCVPLTTYAYLYYCPYIRLKFLLYLSSSLGIGVPRWSGMMFSLGLGNPRTQHRA